MLETIFGVVKNPHAEDELKDEWIRNYWLVITPKNIWEEEHCQADHYPDPDVFEAIEDAGFGEIRDGTFEANERDMSPSEIQEIMESLGFVRNLEFEQFCADRLD